MAAGPARRRNATARHGGAAPSSPAMRRISTPAARMRRTWFASRAWSGKPAASNGVRTAHQTPCTGRRGFANAASMDFGTTDMVADARGTLARRVALAPFPRRVARLRLGLASVDMPLQPGAMQNRGCDFFDRPAGGIDRLHPLTLHQRCGFANLELAVGKRGVLACRAAGLPELLQAFGVDRQAEELIAKRHDGARQLPVDKVVRCQRKVGCENAELQGEIKCGRSLAAAGDADQDDLRLDQIACRGTIVVRLREVDRLHAREIFMAVGDAMRSARRVRRLRGKFRFEWCDEYLKQVEHHRVGAPQLRAHDLVDDGAEDQRTSAFSCRGLIDPAQHVVDLIRRVDEWNRAALKIEALELRQ